MKRSIAAEQKCSIQTPIGKLTCETHTDPKWICGVTRGDLNAILAAMLTLAEGEGCTVRGHLTKATDAETADRILTEIFDA